MTSTGDIAAVLRSIATPGMTRAQDQAVKGIFTYWF